MKRNPTHFRCGHPRAENAGKVYLRDQKYPFQNCRQCKTDRARDRYRHDPEFRARVIARARRSRERHPLAHAIYDDLRRLLAKESA